MKAKKHTSFGTWVALGLVLGVAGCQPAMESTPGETPRPARLEEVALSAPTIKAALDATGVLGEAFTGEWVLVHVFGPWDAASRAETEAMASWVGAWQEKGLGFLGIAVQAEANELGGLEALPFPVVAGSPGLLATLGDVRALPTRLLMSREGNVIARFSGYVAEADLHEALERVLPAP
ncbi:MAG TPA: TlpA disulfide reductase family protein [Kiritimatiellia bacterium]|nr:TlpA disulfide reductase family protein [Kiritimatiellia bacterium]